MTDLNQVWLADITFVAVSRGFVYLACVLEAHSRRCLGWALSKEIDTALTLNALDMALQRRPPPPGLIHHSDQGVQYASASYIARLEQWAVVPSMAAKGNPYENAMMERFIKTVKHEEVKLKERYADLEEARENIGPFIEAVYSRKRLHSALGYKPPVEFEEELLSKC